MRLYRNILPHICHIDNHPVKYLSESIQHKYLKGLAAILYKISNGDLTMKTLFSQWAFSIADKDSSDLFQRQSMDCVKKALSINRIGFHFFRCKHDFFFDCFYLTESFDERLLPDLTKLLELVGTNVFTTESLKKTSIFFCGSCDETFLKATKCLQVHRCLNANFRNKKQKRVLVVANVSAGKSTLINAFIGYRFNNVRTTACTTKLCEIYNKPIEDGFSYMRSNHLDFDLEIDAHTSVDASQVAMHFNSSFANTNICFIDTPGVNNSTDTEHWEITTTAISKGEYDLIVFVSNGRYNGTVDERRILKYINEYSKKPVLFVLNQLDSFKRTEDSISEVLQEYTDEIKAIGFECPKVFPVSALYAFMLRFSSKLVEDEFEELQMFQRKFSKDFYNLTKYIGCESTSDIERSGIVLLEKEIINQLENV